MTPRPSAADFNRLFRGGAYGAAPIFTARSYAAFVQANDIDLARAISTYDGSELIGALAFAQRGERAWFGLIGVAEHRRRDGIGRDLFVRACERARAGGVRSIELETVQRNRAAIAMVAAHGFEPVGELLVWARKPRRVDAALPRPRRYEPQALAPMREPPCWQREPASIAAAGPLSRIEVRGAHALLRLRAENGMVADAQATDENAAQALLAALDERVPHGLTLNNEPAGSPLSKVLAANGWRVVERQYRIKGC